MGNPLYLEKEVVRRIKELCKREGILMVKGQTKEGPALKLYKEGKSLGVPIEYSIRLEGKMKTIPSRYISQLAKDLSSYLRKYDRKVILNLLEEKGKVSERRLEEIIEGAVYALIILGILFMSFARNITSFAIYEGSKINTPMLFILVSFGILLVLLYWLSKKI